MKYLAIVAIACLVCLAASQNVRLDLPRDCKEVTVKGTIKENADLFFIDLFSPHPLHPNSFIAEHSSSLNLNVNWYNRNPSRWNNQGPFVVMASFDGSKWNQTEIRKDGSALKPGSEFKLRIFINDYDYDVYLNDVYFSTMPWRMDHALATHIRVGGDIILSSITRTIYYHTISNSLLPLRINLDTSNQVRIHGRVADKADNIVYDLENANGIAFHAAFRLNENVLVLNSLINKNWQAEQREKLPVARGQIFSHKIASDATGFKISGDDFEYVFARPSAANSILIHGSLTLKKVSITKRY